MYGNIIKNLRLENNLKQQDLARILKTAQCTIAKYENEQLEPNINTLQVLANHFNCSVDYILGRESEDHIIIVNNKQQSQIEELYEKLDRQNKIMVLGYITALIQKQNNKLSKE